MEKERLKGISGSLDSIDERKKSKPLNSTSILFFGRVYEQE